MTKIGSPKVKAAWSSAKAKAEFCELIYRAEANGPQTVTRRGRRVAVIVSLKEWERTTKVRKLGQ
jgi:prevent-host-death family protein